MESKAEGAGSAVRPAVLFGLPRIERCTLSTRRDNFDADNAFHEGRTAQVSVLTELVASSVK